MCERMCRDEEGEEKEYLTKRTITKSTHFSSSSSSTHVPPQLSIAVRTLAERASARTRNLFPTNILGGEPSGSGDTWVGESGRGRNSDWAFRNGCRDAVAGASSDGGSILGANDLERVNFASALWPLLDVGGFGGSKARAFPFPLAALDRKGDGSGVGLRPSAGAILINSDPTLEYPRGARRLSQTRSVAEGTRRATAISSSSGVSGTDCACSWEASTDASIL
jgi:hypothetical protein